MNNSYIKKKQAGRKFQMHLPRLIYIVAWQLLDDYISQQFQLLLTSIIVVEFKSNGLRGARPSREGCLDRPSMCPRTKYELFSVFTKRKEKKRASLMMPMNDKFSIFFSSFLFLYWVFNSEGQIYGPAFACSSGVAGNYYLLHSTWKIQRQSFQNFPPHEKCYDVYRFWCKFFYY